MLDCFFHEDADVGPPFLDCVDLVHHYGEVTDVFRNSHRAENQLGGK